MGDCDDSEDQVQHPSDQVKEVAIIKGEVCFCRHKARPACPLPVFFRVLLCSSTKFTLMEGAKGELAG